MDFQDFDTRRTFNTSFKEGDTCQGGRGQDEWNLVVVDGFAAWENVNTGEQRHFNAMMGSGCRAERMAT